MSSREQTPDDPPRWREASADPRALSARAADLVDAVRDVAPLPPETLARIKVDVVARRPPRAATGLPLGLRFALLTGLVLASVATASGTKILWHRFVATPTVTPLPPRHHASSSAPSAPRSSIVIEPVPALAPVEEPPAAPPPPPSAAVPRPHRPAPSHKLALLDEPASTANDEAQLLGRVLSHLRGSHDPRGALALLDQYDRSFPHGVLESEALSARLEAIIQLDDRKTALAVLDGRATFAGRLGSQLLLTRAELRASAGRYPDALADFDRLLAPSATAMPAEATGRALYGRAVSLGHLGLGARARADLLAYQKRFPDGKFAAEVARLLKGAATSDVRP
jgi:hypothetical protein